MANRIPQDFIDELINRIDIVELIDARVKLRKMGRDYGACCPFHQEKNPSFTVSPSKQFYHCFGCGAHGTGISFLMQYENYEFPEAVEYLANQVGMMMPESNQQQPSAAEKQQSQSLYDLLSQIARYYQRQLREHPDAEQAISYLKNRGLSGSICQRYGIGFAPSGWDNLLQQFGAAKRGTLVDAGMLSNNDSGRYYDRFRKRIMFPIQDRQGRVIGFGGRVLDADDTPKYLNSPETRLFQKGLELYGFNHIMKAKQKSDYILIVEGYMDVIGLAQHGVDNAVATLGTSTSKTHLKRLLRYTPNLVFCFDGDKAGQAAAWRALETALPLIKDGVQLKFLFLPDGEDPDSLIQQQGKAAFETLVAKAQTLSEYFFAKLSEEVDLSHIDGQVRLSKLALPLLQQMPDGVFRQALLQQLAQTTHIDVDYLHAQAERAANLEKNNIATIAPKKTKNKTTPMRVAIAIALQYPKQIKNTVKDSDLQSIKLAGASIFNQLISIINKDETHTASLLEHWREQAEYNYLAQLAAWDLMIPESGIEAELLDSIKRLQQQSDEQEVEQLMQKATDTGLTQTERYCLQELLSKKNTSTLLDN